MVLIDMKITRCIIVLIATILLTSCHTALQVAQYPVNTLHHVNSENMEFIGFKNLNRNNLFSKDYGVELERARIAVNKQNYYMGIYSLQELATYKSEKRYVAFVDVVKHQYSYNDGIEDNEGLAIGGWFIAGFTCFGLFPVYIPMILCADKNTCLMTLYGSYVLYLYDTEKKEVALALPMEINVQEKYTGQYLHKETNKTAVQERYRNMLYNLWNEYFMKAYRFLEDNHQ